jgi:hypothetical protein
VLTAVQVTTLRPPSRLATCVILYGVPLPRVMNVEPAMLRQEPLELRSRHCVTFETPVGIPCPIGHLAYPWISTVP